MKSPMIEEECYYIDVIDTLVEDSLPRLLGRDLLDECLCLDTCADNLSNEEEAVLKLAEKALDGAEELSLDEEEALMGLMESEPYKECEESEIAMIMHKDCEESVTYDKEERMMDNFENPFFEESWDSEGEDKLVEILEVKWDVNDDLFEEYLEDDPLGDIDYSTPCIWDDHPNSLYTHIFDSHTNHCEVLSDNIEDKEYDVDSIDKIDGIEDPLRVVSLGSLFHISLSSTCVDLIPSFPLLHPPMCLNSLPLYAYDSSEVFVTDFENCEPPIMLFETNFDKPPFDVGWGDLVVSYESFYGAYDIQQRSLTSMFFAYTLSCGYLCFCIAHAQVFDRLLRAMSCFDLSICAR